MKKFRIGAAILLFLVIIGISISALLPVDYDAGACSGGYESFIVEKYEDDIMELIEEELESDYFLLSDFESCVDKVYWKDRTLYLDLQIGIKGEVQNGMVILHFVGQRFWYDTYSWMLVEAVDKD